jgi:tetratricopeptide (TPR) repeat protein
MFDDAARQYQQLTGNPPSWRAVDRFYLKQGLRYWRAAPLDTLKLFGLKLYWFVTARNYGDIYQPRHEAAAGLPTGSALAPLATPWLIGLGLVGLVGLAPRRWQCWPEWALLLVPLITVVLFWYSPRYRLPAVPAICVLSALAVVHSLRRGSQRRWLVGSLVALAATGALTVCNHLIGFDHPDERRAPFECNLAGAYRQLGNGDKAVQHYEEALQAHPDLPEARTGLGIALIEQGQIDEGIEQLRRALAFRPDDAETYHNLGAAYVLQNKLPQAIDAFRQALRLAPGYAEAHASLGRYLLAMQAYDEAIEPLQAAHKLKPNDPMYAFYLSAGLIHAGRPDEAAEIGRRAELLAHAQGQPALAARLRQELDMYRSALTPRQPEQSPETRPQNLEPQAPATSQTLREQGDQ